MLAALAGLCGLAAPGIVAVGNGASVEIRSPTEGQVIVRGGEATAVARIALSPRARVTTVLLNGTEVPIARSRNRRLATAELDKARGLQFGRNHLSVRGVLPGGKRPGGGVSFTVARPRPGLAAVVGSIQDTGLRVRFRRAGQMQVTARLNGRKILSWSGRAVSGRQLHLPISAATGLRHGRNQLVVRVADSGRAHHTRLARSIVIARAQHVLGHRARGDVSVGESVLLDAGSTRPPQTGASGAGSTFTWRVVGRPTGSRLASRPRRGERVRLRPDVPGGYTLRVNTTSGGASARSTFTIEATHADPLVPIRAVSVPDPTSPEKLVIGIKVKDKLYPSDAAIQILALDAATLGLVKNQSFPVETAPSVIDAFLKTFTNNQLVIVNFPAFNRERIPGANIESLDAAFGQIGGVTPKRWEIRKAGCWSGEVQKCFISGDTPISPKTPVAQWTRAPSSLGSFWMIGKPGMRVGSAWRGNDDRGDGRLDGYLTQGTRPGASINHYAYVSGADQNVLIETCTGPDADPATGCTVKVGADTYQTPKGQNGVFVLALDRVTLKPLSQGFADSADELANLIVGEPPAAGYGHYDYGLLAPWSRPAPAQPMQPFPKPLWDGRLLILQTVGTGVVTKPPGAGGDIAPLVDKFGITIERLAGGAITPSGSRGSAGDIVAPYAAVGVPSNLPFRGTAVESSKAIATSQSGTVRTLVARGPDSRYTPLAYDPIGNANGNANLQLPQIIYQEKQPWPYADEASQQAIEYIARGINLADWPDIRSAYLDLNINFDRKANSLTQVEYPQDDPSKVGGVSKKRFNDIKDRLEQEFGWVEETRGLIDNIIRPLDETQFRQATSIAQVTQQVSKAVPPPPSGGILCDVPRPDGGCARLNWRLIFTGSFKALGLFAPKPLSSGLGFVAGMGQMIPMGSDSAGSPDAEIRAKGIDLAVRLADQQEAIRTGLRRSKVLILTDAGKLEAVGEGTDTKAWEWSDQSDIDAASSIDANARAEAYSALVPITWSAWQLVAGNGSYNQRERASGYSTRPTTFECGYRTAQWNVGTPFNISRPPDYWKSDTAETIAGLIPGSQRSPFAQPQGWVLAQVRGAIWRGGAGATAFGPGRNPMVKGATELPARSLMDDIFTIGDHQGTTPNYDSGAGQYPPQWFRDTFNPPSHVQCYTDEKRVSRDYLGPATPGPPAIGPPASQVDLG